MVLYPARPQTLAVFNGNIILGSPTDHSIAIRVNFRSDQDSVYVEYGEISGDFPYRTPGQQNIKANVPYQDAVDSLKPNWKYYYRIRFRPAGQTAFGASPEYNFHTQRARGSVFMFCIQGDSHPERASQFDAALYTRTLQTVAADHPDFYMTIGDDFSVDTLQTLNAATVTARYTLQLPYLGFVANSAPLFLVNGNHEQAARYQLDGTPNNVAVWAQNARNLYYPEPAPDDFYTGNTEQVPYIGLLRNYYSWEWGDALFVTIDPYWSSPVPVDNVLGSGSKTSNKWDVTHGDAQYQWLKQTLEGSKAKWKFVFAHHVIGTGRGGIEVAPYYEWGGRNQDNSWGFAANRPDWPMPIHQLMAANHVTIFFQGHDHLFVHQQLDGVTYQELPEPGDPTYTLWNGDAYDSGDKFANTGYVRVNVSPASVHVEYVRTYLPKDERPPDQVNGMVKYAYTISSDDTMSLVIPTGGSAVASSNNQDSQVQIGYASVIAQTGNQPHGAAVFGLTQNNAVVTECGVPSSPPTTRARLFVDNGTGVILPPNHTPVDISTGLALVNWGTATAKITYTLRDIQGRVLALGHGTLPSGAHRAFYLYQLKDFAPDFKLPEDFASSTRFGTLELGADRPLSILGLHLTTNQRRETILTSIPVADLNAAMPDSRLYFPQMADGDGYSTKLILLNTSGTAQNGWVRFFGDGGMPITVKPAGGAAADSAFRYAIAPGGVYLLQTDGSPVQATVGWAEVVPDNGTGTPVGAGIFSRSVGEVLITESGVPSAQPTTRARIYVDMSNGHDSGIVVAAVGGAPLRLDLKARNSDGTELAGGGTATLDLAGKGHQAAFPWQWIAGLEPGFRGVLDISGPAEFAAITLRSLVNSRREYLLTTFPVADLTRDAPAPMVFPQIGAGGGYKSEIILLSSDSATTAAVSFFGDGGSPLVASFNGAGVVPAKQTGAAGALQMQSAGSSLHKR